MWPLRICRPISLLICKGVLQEMCRHGMVCDNPLTDKLLPRWESWKNDLVNMEKINISWSYAPVDFGKVTKRELLQCKHDWQWTMFISETEKWTRKYWLCFSNGQIFCCSNEDHNNPKIRANSCSCLSENQLGAERGALTDSKVVLGYINN